MQFFPHPHFHDDHDPDSGRPAHLSSNHGALWPFVNAPDLVQHDAIARHGFSSGSVCPYPSPLALSVAMEVAASAAVATAAPGADAPGLDPPFSLAPTILNNLPLLDATTPLVESAYLDRSGMPTGINMPMDIDAMHYTPPVVSDERLTAFARLRFDDGSYYMHTYQVLLGRNIALAHRDMRRLAKADQLEADGQQSAAEEALNGKRGKKRKRDRRGARSVISERGGIVNAPMESMPVEYQQRRQSNASHSLSSSSHPNGETAEERSAERAPQDIIMQAFPEAPAQIDSHVPEDPHDCPLVPIHPQHVTARTGSQGPKGISRQHAKIFYDFDNRHFSAQVLGSNGLFHENRFLQQGEVVPLDHGDRLIIGAVNIQFYLPDVALTADQLDRQESGSRPMSFSFENGHGELDSHEEVSSESEGELSVNPKHVYHFPVDNEEDSDEGAIDDDLDEYIEPAPKPRQKTNLKMKLKFKAPPPPPPKETKKAQKRKHREPTPEEEPPPPPKKAKAKAKEVVKEEPKETKVTKELKKSEEQEETNKAPAKAPAKAPIKTPTTEEPPVAEPAQPSPTKEKPTSSKPPPNDSPPLLRKPFEGELEAGEIEGLITEEMARQHNLPITLVGHVVEKRKGPGRPPKDGLMSKRQRSQLIKQAKEIEKAKAAGIDPADIPVPTMKPKVVKRKDSNAADGEDGDIRETTEGGDGTSLDKKIMKPIKPPRTPSPEMRVEDYTEEQLQRPSANYVVLIHEAISSSPTGQMNLQQIYNYIERKYPWYKFKTTTSGWQSSVRHNLGQHDAFVKGDKEGKGFNWKVNPEVSIEKERRKRQVSPPVSHTQRPPYYPPPGGYPPYGQPSYPYHPGMPQHGMPPATPRLPPSLANAQPRLPPSMARDANASAPATSSGPSHPSPYASPWAGGNTAGSPPVPNPPRPYPPPSSHPPPASSNPTPSGQYGVLLPTSAPASYSNTATASPYGGQYATAGASPYGPTPPRPYAPYPPPPSQPPVSNTAGQPSEQPPQTTETYTLHPSGRYPLSTPPSIIRLLEAFRGAYINARKELGEVNKVDNAIRAFVDHTVPEASLTEAERLLLASIKNIDGLQKQRPTSPEVKQEDQSTPAPPPITSAASAGAAAAIAADEATQPATVTKTDQSSVPPQNAQPQTPTQPSTTPQAFIPNMTRPTSSAASSLPSALASVAAQTHRPSVEPLTPVPGSPAVVNGTAKDTTATATSARVVSEPDNAQAKAAAQESELEA